MTIAITFLSSTDHECDSYGCHELADVRVSLLEAPTEDTYLCFADEDLGIDLLRKYGP